MYQDGLSLEEIKKRLVTKDFAKLRQFPQYEATFADNAASYYHQLERETRHGVKYPGSNLTGIDLQPQISRRNWSDRPSRTAFVQKAERSPRMEYTNLGSTGVKVSRICLGCMTYGVKSWRQWVLEEKRAAIHPAGAGAGHQFLRYRRHVFAGRKRRDSGPRAEGLRAVARPGGDRDQGVQSDGRRSEPAGPLAQAHHARHRRQPAAAGHRLCRSLPDPPLRLRDADRGDDRGAERCREGRQGALHRRLVDVRLAVRQDAAHRRPAWA